jgi:hypothetical protein
MADTLSETEACELLARLFRARGFRIVRNVLFREYGVEFHVDGWDAKARVGFEFMSSEDEDHIDLSLGEYQTLSDAQRRGELALFIIDEVEPLSAADLVAEAADFLDEAAAGVRARSTRKGRRPAPGRKVRGSAKTVARKSGSAVPAAAAKKSVVKKPAGTKTKSTVKAGKRAATAAATGKKTAGAGKTAGARKPAAKTRRTRSATGAAARPAASKAASGARSRRR